MYWGFNKPVCPVNYCKPVPAVNPRKHGCSFNFSKPIRSFNPCKPVFFVESSKPMCAVD